MSYAGNRQTISEVYNYAGNVNTGNYVQPNQSAQRRPINEFRTSNVQPVNLQRTSNAQPVIISQPIISSQPVVSNVQKNSQFKGSKAQ